MGFTSTPALQSLTHGEKDLPPPSPSPPSLPLENAPLHGQSLLERLNIRPACRLCVHASRVPRRPHTPAAARWWAGERVDGGGARRLEGRGLKRHVYELQCLYFLTMPIMNYNPILSYNAYNELQCLQLLAFAGG